MQKGKANLWHNGFQWEDVPVGWWLQGGGIVQKGGCPKGCFIGRGKHVVLPYHYFSDSLVLPRRAI